VAARDAVAPHLAEEERPALDVARLAAWMDGEGLAGTGRRPSLAWISGGSQNQLYAVDRGGVGMALRMPPASASPDRLKAFEREIRVLSAIRDTDVPHPRLMAATMDTDVLGSPFYLMDRIDGWSVMQTGGWPPPFDADVDARRGLAFALVEGAARLARVDWRSCGLEGFGKPDGFHDRQVDRWLAFLEPIRTRDIPHLDDVATWLRSHRPRAYEPGIMHGDYSFANVMFRHDAPADLAAIIDWEMATIGDPLLDVGWALMGWPPEGLDILARPPGDLIGMPSRDEVLEHYELVSGRQVEDFDYYVVLARFKLGIVLEQSVYRHAQGLADERVAAWDSHVLNLIEKAAELAGAKA
jgi:aminoglycoside phosphotransferase (APT) family kinase protein